MKTTESIKRAQAIINEADDETADLIYEMWNELVRHEKREKAHEQVLEYWKVRASAAEERIERAILVSRLDTILTAGEEILKRRMIDALKSKITNYEPPLLAYMDMLLTAVTDKEFGMPGKIRALIDKVTPDELVGLLNSRGWILNPKLSQEHESPTSVMVSPRGTQVPVPMDVNDSEYVNKMTSALYDYSRDLLP